MAPESQAEKSGGVSTKEMRSMTKEKKKDEKAIWGRLTWAGSLDGITLPPEKSLLHFP